MQNSLKKNDSVNVPVDLKVSQTNSDQNKLVIQVKKKQPLAVLKIDNSKISLLKKENSKETE